ncbi:TetR/AcrR family transcriptional regulator [Mycolicibacterium aubagnense]
MLFWRKHPEEPATAMVARAHRVLAAMAGHPLDGATD